MATTKNWQSFLLRSDNLIWIFWLKCWNFRFVTCFDHWFYASGGYWTQQAKKLMLNNFTPIFRRKKGNNASIERTSPEIHSKAKFSHLNYNVLSVFINVLLYNTTKTFTKARKWKFFNGKLWDALEPGRWLKSAEFGLSSWGLRKFNSQLRCHFSNESNLFFIVLPWMVLWLGKIHLILTLARPRNFNLSWKWLLGEWNF